LTESDKKQSFWTTLPGFLTGIAALLTAVTGLLVTTYPHGFAGGKESPTAAMGSAAETARAAPAAGGGSSPALTPSVTPQRQKATVLVTAKDGTATRMFLKNFKHNYYDEAIELKSGQSISFDKIKSIDFSTVHDYQMDVKVTLTDGRALDGALATGYAFKGETDIGPFTIQVVNLKQILFER
jgi:hypothetical protein